MQYRAKTHLASLSLLASLILASTAYAGPVDPGFEELGDNPIAEFRGNGGGSPSDWSFGTGMNTQTSGSFDEAGYSWVSGFATFWSFNVTGNTSTLTVGDVSTQYTGLTLDQLNANTLAIHAKDNVAFTYDFGSLGSGSLQGNADDRFGVDWSYLSLDGGLDGISGSGTITFLDEIIKDRSGTGVTFKIGNMASVPEPGTLALLGFGLFGLAAARRLKTK